MSHFLCVVLLNKEQLEVEGILDTLMEPFNENTEVEPYRDYLDGEDLERGVKRYGSEQALIENMQDWSGRDGGMDLRGIYSMSTYNPKSKWDWLEVGGRWEGYLTGKDTEKPEGQMENNSCLVRDLPEDFKCFAIVTPDGEWHSKERMMMFGGVADEKSDWYKEMLNILGQHSDCLAVGLDCYI